MKMGRFILRSFIILSILFTVVCSTTLKNINKAKQIVQVKIYSIPDSASVYIARLSKPEGLFNLKHLKGKAPLNISLESDDYYIGFLVSPPPGLSRFCFKDEKLTKNVLQAAYGEVLGINVLADLKPFDSMPIRTSLTPEEEEPYVQDISSGPPYNEDTEFNQFYYNIKDFMITEVGSVYKITVSNKSNQIVGMILPSKYMPISENLKELDNFYPKENRFNISNNNVKIDSLFDRHGIPHQHRGSILDLLQRGGKVIYSGRMKERLEGSLSNTGNIIRLKIKIDDIKQPLLLDIRDIFFVDGSDIRVFRYSSGIIHSSSKEPFISDITDHNKLLPDFDFPLIGLNEVRIVNPNNFSVTAGLRSSNKGKDFSIPANESKSVFVPDGNYDIYFVYSSKPDALFQGDSFSLNGNGVEIQIVKVVGGNYNIKRVK